MANEPGPPYALIGILAGVLVVLGVVHASWDARLVAAAIILHRCLRDRRAYATTTPPPEGTE